MADDIRSFALCLPGCVIVVIVATGLYLGSWQGGGRFERGWPKAIESGRHVIGHSTETEATSGGLLEAS